MPTRRDNRRPPNPHVWCVVHCPSGYDVVLKRGGNYYWRVMRVISTANQPASRATIYRGAYVSPHASHLAYRGDWVHVIKAVKLHERMRADANASRA